MTSSATLSTLVHFALESTFDWATSAWCAVRWPYRRIEGDFVLRGNLDSKCIERTGVVGDEVLFAKAAPHFFPLYP